MALGPLKLLLRIRLFFTQSLKEFVEFVILSVTPEEHTSGPDRFQFPAELVPFFLENPIPMIRNTDQTR